LVTKFGLSFEFIIERDALRQNCNNVDRDPLKCLDVNVGRCARKGAAKHSSVSPHHHLVYEQVKPRKTLYEYTMFSLLLLAIDILHVDNAKISQTYILFRSIDGC